MRYLDVKHEPMPAYLEDAFAALERALQAPEDERPGARIRRAIRELLKEVAEARRIAGVKEMLRRTDEPGPADHIDMPKPPMGPKSGGVWGRFRDQVLGS